MSDPKNIHDQKPMPDHEYDGIHELNHPAPFWWQLFFYISIIFSIGYVIYYNLGSGQSSDQQIQNELAEVKRLQSIAPKAQVDEVKLIALTKDPEALKIGKAQYTTNCVACHGSDGGGLIGPNLADKFWIHGNGSVLDLHRVLTKGVLEKGMPAWEAVMRPADLNAVVAYVKNFQGTSPANPKAPQGNEAP